jgi:tetraacyldisaccharide 4'-kinase
VTASLEAIARRTWTARTPGTRVLRAALVPAALVYGAASALRNRLYDAGWLPSRRVPAWVVSVGNLTVGGTGKTPTALWLAERLAARRRRPGIVARGYGKRRAGVVVVGEAGEPLVDPDDGGDEAVLLARRFAGPVVTGERRAEAAAFACAHFALDTVVLDDGFQHRALVRDADLVLATADALVTWPLPAGPLREAPASLARARAVLAIDGEAPAAGHVPVFTGALVPVALVGIAGDGSWYEEDLASLASEPVVAASGIARPERFSASLRALGAHVVETLTFPDHHRYGKADAARIADVARGRRVIVTEKDLVKLAPLVDRTGVRALRMSLTVDDGDRLVDLLLAP